MNNKKINTPDSGMTRGDVYFVFFRRKWLILGFSLAGILAAVGVYFIFPPQYQSEADLALSTFAPDVNTLNTEIRTLQSLDLAQQAVQALTPEKILAGVGHVADTNAAAYFVRSGLKVEPVPDSNVIRITFRHPDKEIVQPALKTIIQGYFIKHRMWSSPGVSVDGVTHDVVRPASNITIIQLPTPPLRDWPLKMGKAAAGMAVGGILAGLGLAFLMELGWDRSVKRPSQIVTKLGLPLFISIPEAKKNGNGKSSVTMVRTPGNGTLPGASIPPWDREHPLRRFYEGLRDRLVVYFEVRHAVHKPKLLAVTSCGHGAGVSSIAAGLAATLSETGDGNVLLVNISGDKGAAREFYKGELGCSLEEVLETGKKCGLVKASLYTISGHSDGNVLPASLARKLSALMPRLKASEYDYIIFDMPPVNRTSVTARLSGLVDIVLLVIESEKTNQDMVKDVIGLLGESNPIVSTVLNKSRSYVPASLYQEFLNPV